MRRVRPPVFAGLFYPREPDACRTLASEYVAPREDAVTDARQKPWLGGIVPHAGWICSGAIAGQTIGTIAQSRVAARLPDVVIVFGAVHSEMDLELAALDDFSSWMWSEQLSDVATELRARLIEDRSQLFAPDDRFHVREHAVEVELPLIAAAFARSAVLPIEVPPVDDATNIGEAVAAMVTQQKLDAVILASSDLTHYGPAYDFAPASIGPRGLEWATENDRRLLDRVERMQATAIVTEARQHQNACGAGAIAAMLATCKALGADTARVLRHANSAETLATAGVTEESDNAVGYAAVVVG